jgi:hypothetical protein
LENNPELSQAQPMESWRRFELSANDPQVAQIFRTHFNRELKDLVGLSFSAVAEIIKAAKHERAVNINSLLEFKNDEKR